ncbi:MAG: MarR family winged helix-turn-helix transcriptional regulator [Actinomycetia bacterium]|nr:MarR family winged helix-turn-helix transcriptional regulator [Actinomycetes bacterium]
MTSIEHKAYIFGSIFVLSNKLQALGDKVSDYMSIKQWLLIAAITKSGKESVSMSEAAALTGTSYQNVKKLAVILQEQGFLKMQRDPSDARVVSISLTSQCREYFSRREGIERDFLQSLFEGIDEKTVAQLYEGIRSLNENVLALSQTKVDASTR